MSNLNLFGSVFNWKQSIYLKSLERFEAGDERFFSEAYCVFAEKDAENMKRCAAALGDYLGGLNAAKIRELSHDFREKTSLTWSISWKDVDISRIERNIANDSELFAVMAIGSFHPDGYFREKCIKKLKELDGSLPYLFIGMNDWVGEVRRAAEDAVFYRLKICGTDELLHSVYYAVRLRSCLRRSDNAAKDAISMIKSRFSDENEITAEKISAMELCERRAFYDLAVDGKTVSSKMAEQYVNCENNTLLQSFLIGRMLSLYDISDETAERWLRSRSGVVRKNALQFMYGQGKADAETAKEFLLDEKKSMRELAAFIVQKYDPDFDFADFYLKELDGDKRYAAVLGLGELSDAKKAEKPLREMLSGSDEKAAALALISLSHIIGDRGGEIYFSYLTSENKKLAAAAYRAAMSAKPLLGADNLYQLYRSVSDPVLKRRLIMLMMHENSWERLPYLLEVYGSEGIAFQTAKAVSQRNVYAKISSELAEKIRIAADDALSCGRITNDIYDLLIFDLEHLHK